MSMILPINVEDLLHCQGVESARVEFKASWDAKTTGYQVLKTICAFANDLQNLNGGYIVIGVAEEQGRATMPPQGLLPNQIDEIQKWIRGNCKRLDPEYQPIMSPEVVSERQVLVLWVPASDVRPHRAPDGEKGDRKYFVRLGSESIDAEKSGVLGQLIEQTAKVPFDDRRALQATIQDLREGKVREFLNDIRSGLVEERNTRDMYRKLRISSPVNGHDAPRNIGLLLFSEDPEIWFLGARIEVIQFAAGAAGDVLEEHIFRGGLHEQLHRAVRHLETLSTTQIVKQEHSFKVKGWVSYPVPALREALVNAVYHKAYNDNPEPIKVYLYPDRIEVINYPGPVLGIQLAHLKQELPMPPAPARNRRIGEFLKELKLAEGRGTGLPKIFKSMRENGSHDPVFDFDDDRSYFRVTLPAHPEYVAISALRDAAHLKAIGDDQGAFMRIELAWQALPSSPTLATEYLRQLGLRGRLTDAGNAFAKFKEQAAEQFHPYLTNVLIELLLAAGQEKAASDLLAQQPHYLASADALDTAILARRIGDEQQAHRYFERAGDAIFHDAKGLQEFSQTKIALAKKSLSKRDRATNRRLLLEAKELLERAVHMEADRVRHAWAWRDLARVKNWLKHPQGEVIAAYRRAIELLPDERRFQDELARFERR